MRMLTIVVLILLGASDAQADIRLPDRPRPQPKTPSEPDTPPPPPVDKPQTPPGAVCGAGILLALAAAIAGLRLARRWQTTSEGGLLCLASEPPQKAAARST